MMTIHDYLLQQQLGATFGVSPKDLGLKRTEFDALARRWWQMGGDKDFVVVSMPHCTVHRRKTLIDFVMLCRV